MDNPTLYLGVGGLLAVFFLVLIYFFTRTWQWPQIVAVTCVFFASIFLVRYAAAVYRTHNAWRTEEAKSRKQVDELTAKRNLLQHGDLLKSGLEQPDYLQSVSGQVGRAIIDLGRAWRHCTPQGVQPDGSILVNTVPPAVEAAAPAEGAPAEGAVEAPAADAAAPAAPADGAAPAAPAAAPQPTGPAPNRIQPEQVLYVFVENAAPPEASLKEGSKIPAYYLGEFRAAAATDTTVTLAAVFPLSAIDIAVLRQPNQTWSLYETLPVDGHEIFSATPGIDNRLSKLDFNNSADVSPVFGTMDEKLLRVLFPAPDRRFYESDQAFQVAVQRYAVRFQNYLRDGKRATADELPLNVWVKIEFLESYSEAVDSGTKVSALQLGATDDFFDRGLAEVAILQRGAKAEFKAGDYAIFPLEESTRLLQEKTADGKPICKEIERVYSRSLNNYAFLFRDHQFRHVRVVTDIARINRDIAQIKKAQQHANEQVAIANAVQGKLKVDIEKTKLELAKLTEYHAVLEKSWNDLKTQLSLIYRSNLQLATELESINQKRAEETHRRTQVIAGAR